MLNKVRVGNIDDVENLLKACFRRESDENYLKVPLHKHAENETAMKRNEAVLKSFLLNFTQYRLITKFQIIVNTQWQIQAAQNQTQTNTGG